MIEDYGRKLGVLAEYSATSEQKFNIANAELKKVWATVFGYNEYSEKISKLGGMIMKLN